MVKNIMLIRICKHYISEYIGGEYGDYEDYCALGNKNCKDCKNKEEAQCQKK